MSRVWILSYMSYNQSRVDKNEPPQYRKTGRLGPRYSGGVVREEEEVVVGIPIHLRTEGTLEFQVFLIFVAVMI